MGSIIFNTGKLVEHLHEVAGFKAGLAINIEELHDLLSNSSYIDTLVKSEKYLIRYVQKNMRNYIIISYISWVLRKEYMKVLVKYKK